LTGFFGSIFEHVDYNSDGVGEADESDTYSVKSGKSARILLKIKIIGNRGMRPKNITKTCVCNHLIFANYKKAY
jgi:hypothetical protein